MILPWLTLWDVLFTEQTRLAVPRTPWRIARTENGVTAAVQHPIIPDSGIAIIETHPYMAIDDNPISGMFHGKFHSYSLVRTGSGEMRLEVLYDRIHDGIDWAFHEQMETA